MSTPVTSDLARRRGRADRGFTLIEVVVSVVLISTLVVPILIAVSTAVGASARTQHASQVETVIVNVADRVNRAPNKCDYTVYARAAVITQGWYKLASQYEQAAVVTHEWYDKTDGQWKSKPPGDPAPGCPGSGLVKDDLLVQRVTVTVTHPDGDVRRTIQVVKSDV